MTLTQAFYLFILPLILAAVGLGVGYFYGLKGDDRLHPGE